MSEVNRNEATGAAPELPRDWQLLLVDEKMKVVASEGLERGGAKPSSESRDLAEFLADATFDLAEVGELLVCLEDMPSECELRLRLGDEGKNVVARRVESAPKICCVALRPRLDASQDKELPRVWAWASAVARSLGLSVGDPSKAPVRVLIVDQNPEVVSYGKTLVRKLGCKSSGALSGGEALAQAKAWDFDLVLVDDLIPGFGVAVFCQLVRERSERDWGRTPLIVAMTRDHRVHQDSGVLALEKPLALGELKELVQKARAKRGKGARRKGEEPELPVINLEVWREDRELLRRLAQALVAQGGELATRLSESPWASLGVDFARDVTSLMNGCEIVHALRLGGACRAVLSEIQNPDSGHWKQQLDTLLVEIEGFRIFAAGQGLLRN